MMNDGYVLEPRSGYNSTLPQARRRGSSDIKSGEKVVVVIAGKRLGE